MTLRRILSAVFVPLFLFMAVAFPMEKSYAAGSLNLLYNHQMLINIGSQGQWADKTKNDDYNQSCSAFCLTYAHALITNGNEINDPSYYWGGSPWPKAGYTADYYASDAYNKLFVLQKAYDELNERRLPILFVTLGGYTNEGPYRHYVLVVGYQNVTSRDSLTEGNFLVIDPNKPSMVKTLGKTGYGGQVTLGYKGRVGIAYSKATNERVHWFGNYSIDETKHWYECIDTGCPDKASTIWGEGLHVYDNDADTDCNVCGYERGIISPATHTNAKVKMNYPVNIKKTPYASGKSVYECSVDETFDIGAYGLNSYGNVWYQILSGPYAGNYIYSGETELVKYVNDLSITAIDKIPANIVQGTVCSPSETITSRHNITKVTGAIYSAETYKLIYSGSVSPNVHDSYSTANTAITEALKFHLLAPGKYIYVVTAAAEASLDFQAKGSANGKGITCLNSETFNKSYLKGFTVSAAPHEHTYGDWSKDGTNHWHECTDANCTDKVGSIKDTAAHVYDNDADTDCNVCGYVRSITPPAHEHTYGDWSKDGTNHWHECTDANCTDKVGSIKDTAAHVYDDDADTDCNVCGYVRSITPPAHEHTYGDWSKDGTSHWHECTCGDKADMAAHSFRWIIDRAATATQKGSKHEECTVCGYRRAAVEIPATGTTTGGTTGTPGGGHGHYHPTTTPVPVIVIPPKTGDMTIWQSILHFLGIR